jgi:hypothetical protein
LINGPSEPLRAMTDGYFLRPDFGQIFYTIIHLTAHVWIRFELGKVWELTLATFVSWTRVMVIRGFQLLIKL